MREKAQGRLREYQAQRIQEQPTVEEKKLIADADFATFCGQIEIITVDGPRVPLHLNAIQRIFEVNRSGRDVVLKPRQVGLTTLEVARDLWTFLTIPGAQVVIVCQSVTGDAPLNTISKMITVMVQGLRSNGWSINFASESRSKWTLENGNSLSIIVAGASKTAAEKKGRSGTITRLHLTEVAFYEHADSTLNALLECVPLSGEIVIESTANGAAGLFFEYYQKSQSGQSSFKSHFFPWFFHDGYLIELEPEERLQFTKDERALLEKGVTPEQIKWRRFKLSDKSLSKFNQEYPVDAETCFIVSGSCYFDATGVEALIENSSKPIELRSKNRIRIYKPPVKGESYVLALDTSEGVGGDPSAGIVLVRATGEHVATIDGQYSPAALAEEAIALGLEYNEALVAPERNNTGHAVILALTREDERGVPAYRNVYEHEDGRLGFPTNSATRPQMLSDLEDAITKGILKTRDTLVTSQFRTFVLLNGKPQAAKGAHDDMVLAYAIAWQVRQTDQTGAAKFLSAMAAIGAREGRIFQ